MEKENKESTSSSHKLSIILCFVLGSILILLGITYLCGIRCYAVETGSMGKDIPIGSLAVDIKIRESKVFDQLEVGDDITFRTNSGKVLTHRIIEIDLENAKITTQSIIEGAIQDEKISPNQVLGKVLFSIPLVGYPIIFIKNNLMFILIILIIIIIIGIVSYFLIKEVKKKQN